MKLTKIASQLNVCPSADFMHPVVCHKTSSFSDFEPVTISIPEHMLQKDTYLIELMIHLPNRISCAIKIDSRTNGFATILKQLVSLC